MTDFSPRQIEMINKARRIAQVSYPEFEETKEWMLGLAEVAQEFKDYRDSEYEDHWTSDEVHVKAQEIADEEVPHMTYRLWLIWTDLQLYQEWPDIAGDYGMEIKADDIEKIPQLACYEIALRVLNGW